MQHNCGEPAGYSIRREAWCATRCRAAAGILDGHGNDG